MHARLKLFLAAALRPSFTQAGEWERCLEAIGAPQLNVRRGCLFNGNQIPIQAVPTGKRCCLVYPAGALDHRRVAAVSEWIVAEAGVA